MPGCPEEDKGDQDECGARQKEGSAGFGFEDARQRRRDGVDRGRLCFGFEDAFGFGPERFVGGFGEDGVEGFGLLSECGGAESGQDVRFGFDQFNAGIVPGG